MNTLLLLSLLWISASTTQNNTDREEWVPLFNGRDLADWIVKIRQHEPGINFGDTFRVEDGVIKVRYDKYGAFDNQFGHIFYKTPFSHYRLRVEYRFLGEQSKGAPEWAVRNSGIMLHSQDPRSMPAGQDFPISIEFQFLGGLGAGARRSTGNMCSPGTHIVYEGKLETRHCINSTSDTYDGDQWVVAEALVLGGSKITHLINGKSVIEYTEPQIGGRRRLRPPAGNEAGRESVNRGIHRAAKREPSDRVSQSRVVESQGMHGSRVAELQTLLRRVRSGELQIAFRSFEWTFIVSPETYCFPRRASSPVLRTSPGRAVPINARSSSPPLRRGAGRFTLSIASIVTATRRKEPITDPISSAPASSSAIDSATASDQRFGNRRRIRPGSPTRKSLTCRISCISVWKPLRETGLPPLP
jgi:hypothetical protein